MAAIAAVADAHFSISSQEIDNFNNNLPRPRAWVELAAAARLGGENAARELGEWILKRKVYSFARHGHLTVTDFRVEGSWSRGRVLWVGNDPVMEVYYTSINGELTFDYRHVHVLQPEGWRHEQLVENRRQRRWYKEQLRQAREQLLRDFLWRGQHLEGLRALYRQTTFCYWGQRIIERSCSFEHERWGRHSDFAVVRWETLLKRLDLTNDEIEYVESDPWDVGSFGDYCAEEWRHGDLDAPRSRRRGRATRRR